MKILHVISLILFGMLINTKPLMSQVLYSGKGEVVAVRLLELKKDVDIEEFEKFAVKEFNPKNDGVVPGLREYIAKSDRGISVNSYALFMIFDSQNNRKTMTPNKQASEWFNKILEDQNLWALWNKLGTYVTDESLSNYNDYVELR